VNQWPADGSAVGNDPTRNTNPPNIQPTIREARWFETIAAQKAYDALGRVATALAIVQTMLTGLPPLEATPAGRVFTAHYLYETGPVRNIPGSVVDEAIDFGRIAKDLPDRTVYYHGGNNITVVQSKTTREIMSARKGIPGGGY
jgi:hypothetical protein